MKYAIVTLGCLVLACGCTVANDYRVPRGAKTDRSYRSVAGSVQIGSEAVVARAKTVAGNIEIDDGATTRSISSVAGDIFIGKNVTIDGAVSTVAGDIRIGAGTRISGKVTSIAGDMDLDGCRIEDRVRITKGSLHTSGTTALPGGILVRHARSTDDDDNSPTIDIGSGADIARIEVEPDTPVDLRISRSAHIGPITGATPTYY
jgi:carbonic anhydrase/acetyltransferase-like protein (isoleucine patch superfamily)